MTALVRNNVKTKGDGPKTMIFAHGFGCDQSMWRYLVAAFEKQFRLVLFDLVGAGNSDFNAYDRKKYATLDGYANDLLEICEELEISDAIFVGHSVSAMIGVLAANKNPSRFSHLVLIGPSPSYINDGDYVGGFERREIEAMLKTTETDYFGWARAMGPAIMGNQEDPALGLELTDRFCRTNPEIAKHFAQVVFLSDNRADLKQTQVPSLLLQCSQDIVAPESVGRYMHKQMPGSTLKILKATGHCPHVSAPEETIQAIRAYLSERANNG